jgi:hypothetical protein
MIGNGWIHTYKTLNSAILMSNFIFYEKDMIEIYKCIIPKGTRYFEGADQLCLKRRAYASDTIRFIEKVL